MDYKQNEYNNEGYGNNQDMYNDYNQNNYMQQNTYQDPYRTYDYEVYGPPMKQSGIGIAGMILGILGFFLNPLYLCSLLAIIFGIVGCCKNNVKKGCAIAAVILGPCSLIWQIIIDFVFTIFTMGFGSVSFFC